MVICPRDTAGAALVGLNRDHAPAHASHQGPTPAPLSQGLSQRPETTLEGNNIVTARTRLAGSWLPGRGRAPESLVGGSGGSGLRLRKGRWVLREPIGTPTP